MKDAIDFLDRIEGHGYGGTADYEVARTTVRDAAAEIERLRAALEPFAAIGARLNTVGEDVFPSGARARFLNLDGLTVGDFRNAGRGQ